MLTANAGSFSTTGRKMILEDPTTPQSKKTTLDRRHSNAEDGLADTIFVGTNFDDKVRSVGGNNARREWTISDEGGKLECFGKRAYMTIHLLPSFDFAGLTLSATRAASVNASLTPLFRIALHSRYLSAPIFLATSRPSL